MLIMYNIIVLFILDKDIQELHLYDYIRCSIYGIKIDNSSWENENKIKIKTRKSKHKSNQITKFT